MKTWIKKLSLSVSVFGSALALAGTTTFVVANSPMYLCGQRLNYPESNSSAANVDVREYTTNDGVFRMRFDIHDQNGDHIGYVFGSETQSDRSRTFFQVNNGEGSIDGGAVEGCSIKVKINGDGTADIQEMSSSSYNRGRP